MITYNFRKNKRILNITLASILALAVIFLIFGYQKYTSRSVKTASALTQVNESGQKEQSIQSSVKILESPNTIVQPTYDLSGNSHTAPGLKIKSRAFAVEPSRVAYITIDDGPYPQSTPRLLEVLKQQDIKATFFDVGRQIEQYPSLLKDEYDQGHSIGNHTYSHNYGELYKSPEAFLADVNKNDKLIFKTIGVHPKIIRAPGGALRLTSAYYNLLDANDYIVYDWNIDTQDSGGRLSVDQIVNNVDKQSQNKDKLIILMHDLPGKASSAEAIPIIVSHLKERGFTFGILSPKIRPITFLQGFYK